MREGHCCEGETLWQGRVSVIVEGLCGEDVTVCYKGWVCVVEEGLCCGGGSVLWRRVCVVKKGLCCGGRTVFSERW